MRLTPRAGRDTIDGWRDTGNPAQGDVLRIRVTAPPVDGAANDALVRLLAKTLGIAPSRITIESGSTGRVKTVEVEGVTDDAIRTRLTRPAEPNGADT